MNRIYAVLLLAGLWAATPAPESRAETTSTAATTTATLQESSSEKRPHAATIPGRRSGKAERFNQLHKQFLQRGKEGPIGVLFLGDSITYQWTLHPEIWNRHFGQWNPANFGIGGDRTQNILWRITNGELDDIKPKVMVLMIGTNNTKTDPPEAIAEGVGNIVKITREKLPNTKILLLAIFPRSPGKDQEHAGRIEVINKVNPAIAQLADGDMVRYLDIGDRFLVNGEVPKEVMPDGLHLSEKGYKIWAEAITPVLENLMKETPAE